MTKLETMIREVLQEQDPGVDDSIGSELADFFLRRSRLATSFAFMKMAGTIIFSIGAGIFFFTVDTTQAQIASAVACLIGFIGFSIWWLWYWMVVNRNATLREIKRLELQVAELRSAEAARVE